MIVRIVVSEKDGTLLKRYTVDWSNETERFYVLCQLNYVVEAGQTMTITRVKGKREKLQ